MIDVLNANNPNQGIMLTDGYLDEAYGIYVEMTEQGFPTIPSPTCQTASGTNYLQFPGVALLSKPAVEISAMRDFLSGFDPSLNFTDYLMDEPTHYDSDQLCKTAGQLCYLSLGPKRTRNADSDKYFGNIKSSGHWSVLEHANFSFLFYGISRSLTHELVRHRMFSFSQVSQRYVDGTVLRFVERPEYSADAELHASFMARIDAVKAEYAMITSKLGERYNGNNTTPKLTKTDLRKAMQQVSRSVLPNETEAPIIVTGNARAWKHFLDMRATIHAEPEIRRLAVYVWMCLVKTSSHLFSDYKIKKLFDDTLILETMLAERS